MRKGVDTGDPVYNDQVKKASFVHIVKALTQATKAQKEIRELMGQVGSQDAELLSQLEKAHEKVSKSVRDAETALFQFSQRHPEVYKVWFSKLN